MTNTLDFAGDSISSEQDGSRTDYFITVGKDGTATGRVITDSNSSGNVAITVPTSNEYKLAGDIFVSIQAITRAATLTLAGPSDPVLEGDTATFTINANPTPDKDITVEVDVSDNAGIGYVEDGSHFVHLPANAASATFAVQTNSNSGTTADGTLEATIQDGPGYSHTSPTNTANADVHDADVELTVTNNHRFIYSGEQAIYTISRTGNTINPLSFKYMLTEREDVIDGEDTVLDGTIPVGQSSVVLPGITAKSPASGDFGPSASVTLRLLTVDDDSTLRSYKVATGSNRIGVSSEKPEVTLSIAPDYIFEGDSFDLVATASKKLLRPITVNVTLSSTLTNGFLTNESQGAKTIEIPVTETKGSIEVLSKSDVKTGSNGITGSITATLETGTSYTRPAEFTTKVGVIEAFPLVSISAPELVEEDDGMIAVTLDTGSFRPVEGLPIIVDGLTVTETGSNTGYLGAYTNPAINIGTSGRTTIQVPVVNQSGYDGWGEITLSLMKGDKYRVSTGDNALVHKVIIEDTDPHPSRTIAVAATDQVIEGEDITVTLTNNEILTGSVIR